MPRHGSTARRGTSEVPDQSGSTVLWRGSTVPPKVVVPRPDAVVPWAQEDARFERMKNWIFAQNTPSQHDTTRPRNTQNQKGTRQTNQPRDTTSPKERVVAVATYV